MSAFSNDCTSFLCYRCKSGEFAMNSSTILLIKSQKYPNAGTRAYHLDMSMRL